MIIAINITPAADISDSNKNNFDNKIDNKLDNYDDDNDNNKNNYNDWPIVLMHVAYYCCLLSISSSNMQHVLVQ